MREAIVICILLFTQPLIEAKRGGGGGGGSRGISGARTSVGNAGGGSPGGGYHPNQGGFNQGGGFNRPAAGGYHPQPQPNYGGGMHGPMGGGFQNQGWNNRPSFTSGNSVGSPSRAGTFKHALAGAALGTVGGLLAFEAGKAIINSATSPFHHGNRDYYFDQQNYRGGSNGPRCSMPLSQLIAVNTPAATTAPPATDITAAPGVTTTPSPNQLLQNLQFADGSRPKEVVWGCQANEVCCGTECCPAPASSMPSGGGGMSSGSHGAGTIALIVILGLLITCCLACLCAYKFCRSAIQNFLPSSRNNENQYYDDGHNYGGQQAQSYPMNPYPNQPNYTNQYPAAPPQYNYPPQQQQFSGPKY